MGQDEYCIRATTKVNPWAGGGWISDRSDRRQRGGVTREISRNRTWGGWQRGKPRFRFSCVWFLGVDL